MRSDLFRIDGVVECDPAIERWMKQYRGELGEMARRWFEVPRVRG